MESANRAASGGGGVEGWEEAYLCSFIMGRIPFSRCDSLAERDVKLFWQLTSAGGVFNRTSAGTGQIFIVF